MKITVNSGRYYAEDMAPGAFDACMSALSVYNTAKIKLYNAMYEHRYHEGSDHDVLGKPGTTYASFLKECAGLNAYDAASLYSDVSGILSSQREFRKWYLQTQTEDLKARKAKTASLAKKTGPASCCQADACHVRKDRKVCPSVQGLPAENLRPESLSLREENISACGL